jgi:membrane fusion protein (multidrug efflux system)
MRWSVQKGKQMRRSLGLAVLLASALFTPLMAAAPTVLADATTCLVKPKQLLQLGSPVFGIISSVLVDRGDTVKQGQVVARLDTSVEAAQLELDRHRATNATQIESSRVELQWYQRELARRQQIAGNMFSKANDIDEYVTKVEQTRIAIRRAEADQKTAELEAQRSDRQLQLRIITSPVDGVVTDIKLRPGEFIYEQNPIMIIAQIDPLSVDLVMAGDRYKSVSVGMATQLYLGSPIDATYEAKVDAIDPIIDAASDTFRVRLSLPNPGNAIPAGLRCTVRAIDAAPPQALSE